MSKYKIFYGGSSSLFKPEHQDFLDNIGINEDNRFRSSDKSLVYYNDNIIVKIFYPSTNIDNEISVILDTNIEEILVNDVLAYNHKLNLIIYPKYKKISDIFNFNLIEFIEFISSILKILEAIHEQNIIHQDVSIHNIKLKKNDKYVLIDTETLKKSTDIIKKLYDVKMFVDDIIIQFKNKLENLQEGGLNDSNPKIIILNNHIKVLQIIINTIIEQSTLVETQIITLFDFYGILFDLLDDIKKIYEESNSYQGIFDKYIIHEIVDTKN